MMARPTFAQVALPLLLPKPRDGRPRQSCFIVKSVSP
jgi:hypothetical protein